MKKIILLFTLFYSLVFYSQNYNSHVFYSISRESGEITKEFAENLQCGKTYKSQDFRGRFYVNIQSTEPLIANRFYYLDFGKGLNYYYLTYSRTGAHPDEDYNLSNSTNITQVPCTNIIEDSDNDGINDSEDNCPNQAGPSSNNGCPIPQGKPDFKVTAISINAGGVTKSTNTSSYLNLRSNQNHKFCVTVKNIGNTTGQLDNCSFVLSNGDNLLTSSIIANLPGPSSGTVTIAPNEIKEYCVELYIWDNYLGYSLPSFNYIHTDVDYYNNTDESNETNNKAHASVSYSSSKTPIKLIINDSNGNLINKTIINNKEEEIQLIKGLSKGFYFINKDGKKSQIYKHN